MNKTILLGLVLLLLVGTASAAVYEQNKEYQLRVPCSNDGAACSAAATCNIDIIYPNSTTLILNQGMDNLGGGFFVYNVSDTAANPAGAYSATVFCTDGADNDMATFSYTVTPSGTEINLGQVVLYVVSLLIIIFLFILCLIVMFSYENPKGNKVIMVKYSSFFFSYIIFIGILALSYQLSLKFMYDLPIIFNLFQNLLRIFTILLVPIFLFAFGRMVLLLLQWNKIQKEIKRGLHGH